MDSKQKIIQKIKQWRVNPLLFIREVLKEEPTEQQKEIIIDFIKYRFLAIRSGNKIGKTSVASWLLLWFMCCFREARIPCTSPSESQLKKGIWQETGKWYRKLPDFFKNEFVYGSESLTHKKYGSSWQAYIKTATKENPEVLSGAHSKDIFVILDEGSGISEEVINNILPLLGSHNAYCLLLGNPLRREGFFFNVFHGKPSIFKKLLQYSALDSPLMTKDTIEAWAQAYGRDSSYYKVHVLGEFPDTDSDQLISLHLIDDAKNNNIVLDEYKNSKLVWGVDVGLDYDLAVIVKRKGRKVFEPKKYRQVGDTVKLCGLIKQEWERDPNKPTNIYIDEIGIGRGALDILKGWGLPMTGVNVGTAPMEKSRFMNLKAEIWYKCLDYFVKESPDIPDDLDLISDLVSTKYQTAPSGKIKIRSKEEVKREIGRSTDTGDAFVLTFADSGIIYEIIS